MAIREVWTNFQQGNEELNSWITRISNAIQLANYHALPAGMTIKDRLIRDILLNGCNSQKAKTRIMKEGADVLLPAVINILQEEKQATQFEPKQVNYIKYDARKGKKGKKSHGRKPVEASSSNSSSSSKKSTGVVIHIRSNTWNTAKPRVLCVELATKFDIMPSVVRNQGTFQRRVPRESMYLRKLPLPHNISTKQGKDYQ